jgi:CubicO group peptidase (beta-lactamase class C family)
MDYARFLQMLVNGGELEGVRILGPKTIELMTANHVGTLYNEGAMGFGLGFEVIEHLGRTGRFGSVGAYGWGIAYFQRFFVDPQGLVAVFMQSSRPAASTSRRNGETWSIRRSSTAHTRRAPCKRYPAGSGLGPSASSGPPEQGRGAGSGIRDWFAAATRRVEAAVAALSFARSRSIDTPAEAPGPIGGRGRLDLPATVMKRDETVAEVLRL